MTDMIIVEPLLGLAKQKKKVFEGKMIEYSPFFLTPKVKEFTDNEVMIVPIRTEFWQNDDRTTGVELLMKREIKVWKAVFPFGDPGQTKARVTPNDISYIKTRF